MKINWKWSFYVVILGILVWGFVTPSGIRGAWANNVWSVNFLNQYLSTSDRTELIEQPPKYHKHANVFLIKNAIKQKNYDSALELIKPLLESKNLNAKETYAEILYLKGNFVEAINLWGDLKDEGSLDRALSDAQKNERQDLATLIMQNFYEIDPEEYTIYYVNKLEGQSLYNEGTIILEKSIQNFPDSLKRVEWFSKAGQIYLVQAGAYRQKDMSLEANEAYAQSIANYKKAIELDPESSRGYLNLAWAFFSSGKDREAIQMIEKAIELEPSNVDYFLRAGTIYEHSGFLEKALIAFNNALIIDPINENAKQGVERLSNLDN